MEVGAGTFHPATTLRALGPKSWNAAYVQPSRRPKDGRYGENPNRLQHYYQFQVILKPSPRRSAGALSEVALRHRHRSKTPRHPLRRGRLGEPDARRLGARLGMLVRRHGGVAVHLFPAGRRLRMRAGGGRTDLRPRTAGDVCAGRRERLRSQLQRPRRRGEVSYGDVFLQAEQEYSRHNFEYADTDMLFEQFRMAEQACRKYLERRLGGSEQPTATTRSPSDGAAGLRPVHQGEPRVQSARRARRDLGDRAAELHPAGARARQGLRRGVARDRRRREEHHERST